MSTIHDLYPVTSEQIRFYTENRYLKLKNVVSPEELDLYGSEITDQVLKQNTTHLPMEERDTYSRAFLQVMNLWRESDLVREFVFSKRLAKIAADLMQTKSVRLYHDQALYKEPSGGHTPWHADQYYWPLSSDRCITAWIPLQETPLEMGPLEFAAGSHKLEKGRDLGISDQSEKELDKLLNNNNINHVVEPFQLGEVSFHAGWLFHRAGPNTTNEPRRVMCIIYMDGQMRLKNPENDNQELDWNTWCPGARIDEVIDTPLNPLLFHVKH